MQSHGMTVLRVAVGAIYVTQAYLALFVTSPRAMAAFIAKLGLPTPTLVAVGLIAVHGLGGGMLVVGLWTRAAATLNAAILLVGLLAVYVRQGMLLRGGVVDAVIGRSPGQGYEYVALLLAATLALSAGAGGAGSRPRSK